MKSLVEDALARETSPQMKMEPIQGPIYGGDSTDDELINILKGLRTNIKIVGVGGGGCNTINRIMAEGVQGAETYAANTDAQHLLVVQAHHKVLLGRRSTKGLGAGAIPQQGEAAAHEAEEELHKALMDANIVFVTAGMGGGTGTGAAAVVAQTAKEAGALTIAVVTTPFKGEGKHRMENAEWGLERLRNAADTVIVIPNDKLLQLVPRMPIKLAFKVADDLLANAIRGIAEMVTKPGLVNLDFNDLRTIMKGAGVAMIGLGESSAHADERALEAIQEALNSPLLEVDISTANGALINVQGGPDMTISDAQMAAMEVQKRISPNARIIWGASVDPALEKKMRIMVVISGVKSKQILGRGNEEAKIRGADLDFIR